MVDVGYWMGAWDTRCREPGGGCLDEAGSDTRPVSESECWAPYVLESVLRSSFACGPVFVGHYKVKVPLPSISSANNASRWVTLRSGGRHRRRE
mgnify:CR=1 FL=1